MNPPLLIALIIAFAVVETSVVFWAIVRVGWAPLHNAFPVQPPDQGAISRRFQSFRLGVVNLAFSIHATADERYLHLRPVAPLRWAGARTASIPWESISVTKRSRSGRWITAKIGKRTLLGPAWCLELAEPSEPA